MFYKPDLRIIQYDISTVKLFAAQINLEEMRKKLEETSNSHSDSEHSNSKQQRRRDAPHPLANEKNKPLSALLRKKEEIVKITKEVIEVIMYYYKIGKFIKNPFSGEIKKNELLKDENPLIGHLIKILSNIYDPEKQLEVTRELNAKQLNLINLKDSSKALAVLINALTGKNGL